MLCCTFIFFHSFTYIRTKTIEDQDLIHIKWLEKVQHIERAQRYTDRPSHWQTGRFMLVPITDCHISNNDLHHLVQNFWFHKYYIILPNTQNLPFNDVFFHFIQSTNQKIIIESKTLLSKSMDIFW